MNKLIRVLEARLSDINEWCVGEDFDDAEPCKEWVEVELTRDEIIEILNKLKA